ncbi:hypothetical protein INR49_021939 [Caranx melampygus]|nr:hypothetical protein INR49_021939 [Caranx melampygus]
MCKEKHHDWSPLGSFDPALLIQVHGNTAGGAAAFQRGICLWTESAALSHMPPSPLGASATPCTHHYTVTALVHYMGHITL